MRGVMDRVTPVCTFWMVLANRESPPTWAPAAKPWLARVGTDWPTVMVAAMLSVAMMEGAEMILVRPSSLLATRKAANSRVLPNKAPIVRLVRPRESKPPVSLRSESPARARRKADTPLVKAPVRETS